MCNLQRCTISGASFFHYFPLSRSYFLGTGHLKQESRSTVQVWTIIRSMTWKADFSLILLKFKVYLFRNGEMDEQLRACAALGKDQRSQQPCQAAHNTPVTLPLRGSTALFWSLLELHSCAHKHRHTLFFEDLFLFTYVHGYFAKIWVCVPISSVSIDISKKPIFTQRSIILWLISTICQHHKLFF